MTTPFPFVAGQVLTAAQLNSISELPTRTLTATGNAVAADRYSRVILNGSSISYTVNSATFDVGEVVHLYNINSTAATIAAGTGGVTINAAAGLTLAQYQGATLYAVSSTSFVLWKTDVTQTAAGLTYITGATFTAQTTVAFANDVFTSTYANYLVLFESTGDSAQRTVSLQVRDNAGTKTAANYFGGSYGVNQAGTGTAANSNGATSFGLASNPNNDPGAATIAITVCNPQTSTKKTTFFGSGNVITAANVGSFNFGGQYNVAETHTGLTFTFSAASTGLYRVYGYANS